MTREGSTYLAQTTDDVGGRWSALSPTRIVGKSAGYPAAGGQRDPVGQEPPLGYCIDNHEPSASAQAGGSADDASAPALAVERAAGPSRCYRRF